MAQHDQQNKGQTSRENVPSHGGNSPPQINNYDQGCKALKTMLEDHDVSPVSVWGMLLPAVENLIAGRAEGIVLSFDHSRQQFETQVTSGLSSRMNR